MIVFLTGGCGFIGSHIAHELVKRDYSIVIVDNLSKGTLERISDIKDSVEFHKVDLRNFDELKEVFPKDDNVIVIHTAAQVSVHKSISDPTFDATNNIIGTLNLLNVAKDSGNVKRFIHFSSAAIYGDPKYVPIDEDHPKNPISPYGISKLTSEYYAISYNILYKLNTVAIRPFNVYGPGQNPDDPYAGVITIFISRVLDGKPPIVYGGNQTRDFVNVKDVVSSVILAMERLNIQGEAFNIASGVEVSIKDLAEIILRISGRQDLSPIFEAFRTGDIARSVASIEKAKKLLGYNPKVSLEEGLKEVIEWMKRRKG
ncbi:MAG: GDP-mannose 4,6-dehydratase [Candidatus Asgardarchaeia archaeon]